MVDRAHGNDTIAVHGHHRSGNPIRQLVNPASRRKYGNILDDSGARTIDEVFQVVRAMALPLEVEAETQPPLPCRSTKFGDALHHERMVPVGCVGISFGNTLGDKRTDGLIVC